VISCGLDPAESTGLVVLNGTYDKPVVELVATIHPTNKSKTLRQAVLSRLVNNKLCAYEPDIIVIEGAKNRPYAKGSTKSTIGTGENRGAVNVAVGRYQESRPCRVVFTDAPDWQNRRRSLPRKAAAMQLCRVKFGLQAQSWTGDQVDAAVLALEGLRMEGTK
jgi:hypothetical protein